MGDLLGMVVAFLAVNAILIALLIPLVGMALWVMWK